jgi:uncharacterized delta-60 repeat protein
MNPLLSAWARYVRRPNQERNRSSKRYHASKRLSQHRPMVELLEDRFVLSPTIALSGTGQASEGSPYSLTLGPVVDSNPLHVVKQVTVNWGDGTSDIYSSADQSVQHIYMSPGQDQISTDIMETSVFPDDPSFGGGSVIRQLAPGSGGEGFAITADPTTGGLVQIASDGNILASDFNLVRYNADGSSNNTFGNGTGRVALSSFLQHLNLVSGGGLAVDSAGHILVGGDDFTVGRFNADGSPDTSFAGNGVASFGAGPNSSSEGICLDAQGRIILAGSVFNSAANTSTVVLVRLSSAGAPDLSFGTCGELITSITTVGTFSATNVAEDPTNGDLIVYARADQNPWYLERAALARYHSDGTQDITFGNGNIDWKTKYAALFNGTIPDTTFGSGGGLVTFGPWGFFDTIDSAPFSLAVDSRGRVVLGGIVYPGGDTAVPTVARFNPDGSWDYSIGTNIGTNISSSSNGHSRGIFRGGVGAVNLYSWEPGDVSGLALDAQGRIILSSSSYNAITEESDAIVLTPFKVVEPDGPFLGVATQSVTVQDAVPTAAITAGLPTNVNNNLTAPVGTLLSFSGSFSDNPAESRALTNSDTITWSVTLNGQPYSLPAATITNAPTLSFTPTAVGSYVVSLTVADPDGGSASVQQAIDITNMDANALQNLVNFEAISTNQNFLSDENGSPVIPLALTIQADPTQINAAVAALNSLVQVPLYNQSRDTTELVPVTVTLDLTSGNYSDLHFSLQPPMKANPDDEFAYITAIVNGVSGSTTVVGHSPALTVTSGNVSVNNVTFTTPTDSPTILVSGGSLALRNDVVQESTGFADAAIAVTSGTVDLGSTGNPGNNIININGAGQPVQNTTSTPISTTGNTFESGGTVLPGAIFSSTAIVSSAATTLLNQAVTFTATVQPGGTGTPFGTVDFFDVSSNTDLGKVTLSGGTASLTTTALSAGSNIVQARYGGDATFLPSLGSTAASVLYKFGGFLAPLNSNMALALNRTVPIKFQLTDYNGKYITSLSAVQSLTAPGTLSALRFDSTANQFIANWNTKGLPAGTYTVMLALADGTTYTKSVTLSKNGSNANAQAADGSDINLGGTAGQLLAGDLEVYVDNSNGDLTPDELARIQDAINAVDAVTEPYGVSVEETTDPTQAAVTLRMDSTSPVGGYTDGILGCFDPNAAQITMIAGWDWYGGSDPTQIGSTQYDFQTTVTHELGHALGLGESSDPTSAMVGTLATGTTVRTLTTADLNLPVDESGADAQRAAPAHVEPTSGPSARPYSDSFLARVDQSSGSPLQGPQFFATTGLDPELPSLLVRAIVLTPTVQGNATLDTELQIAALSLTAPALAEHDAGTAVPTFTLDTGAVLQTRQVAAATSRPTRESAVVARSGAVSLLMEHWDGAEASRTATGFENAVSKGGSRVQATAQSWTDSRLSDVIVAALAVAAATWAPSELLTERRRADMPYREGEQLQNPEWPTNR